jgi:glycosyltransferase involved in cell wall biosynthesis
MSVDGEPLRVFWLTPDKSEHISVGRQRIAERLEQRGCDVTLRGTTRETLLTALREREQYDVVIGTTRAGAIVGTLVAITTRCPFVVDHVDPIRQFETTHPRWLSVPVRWLEQLAFSVADHVLYVYAEECSRVCRFASSDSVTKTDLGVEYDRFAEPSVESVDAARSRLSALDLNDHVLVYVGGLEPIYHISTLLDAMRLLDDWTLVVLGTGSLETEVRQAANERSNIEYLGTVPHEEVPGYLSISDVGVSLVDDPHTLKVLEYGAAGLSVVQLGRAARLDGLVEFCEATPEDIARAVRAAGESGGCDDLRTFAKQFDFDVIADDYMKAIDEAVDPLRDEGK